LTIKFTQSTHRLRDDCLKLLASGYWPKIPRDPG
jgi:hypothetical protein